MLLATGGDPRIPNCWGKSAVTIAIDKLDTQYSPAREGLMHLLKRRADEMDAEDTHRRTTTAMLPPKRTEPLWISVLRLEISLTYTNMH